jgi:hypothetical protein
MKVHMTLCYRDTPSPAEAYCPILERASDIGDALNESSVLTYLSFWIIGG